LTNIESIRQELENRQAVPAGARWTSLKGGRTNLVWRVDFSGTSLVCKLFTPAAANPLYPNFAAAEHTSLAELHGAGIAPDPIALIHCKSGDVVLYQHLEGDTWTSDTASVSRLLAQVHHQTPYAGLRVLSSGSVALIAQINGILADCKKRNWTPAINDPKIGAAKRAVLIHTDVVANNIVVTPEGPRLIDWQCPALGDACEDLASFLSPAMQFLYGDGPLDGGDVSVFLAAYPDKDTVIRYRMLAPLFHLRIAAYCQWKLERGDPDYAQALQLELSAINQAECQKE